MKKIFLLLALVMVVFAGNASAESRISTTTTAYNATTLTATVVKLNDAKVYSASFVASSAGGLFVILDATSNTTSTGSFADIKIEGKEATSLNSQFQDFSNKPLEFSTGLVVVVQNGTLVLTYE